MFIGRFLSTLDEDGAWVCVCIIDDLAYFCESYIAKQAFAQLNSIVADFFGFFAHSRDRAEYFAVAFRQEESTQAAVEKFHGMCCNPLQYDWRIERGRYIAPHIHQCG